MDRGEYQEQCESDVDCLQSPRSEAKEHGRTWRRRYLIRCAHAKDPTEWGVLRHQSSVGLSRTSTGLGDLRYVAAGYNRSGTRQVDCRVRTQSIVRATVDVRTSLGSWLAPRGVHAPPGALVVGYPEARWGELLEPAELGRVRRSHQAASPRAPRVSDSYGSVCFYRQTDWAAVRSQPAGRLGRRPVSPVFGPSRHPLPLSPTTPVCPGRTGRAQRPDCVTVSGRSVRSHCIAQRPDQRMVAGPRTSRAAATT
jgi:hypothetical protein